MLQGGLGVTGYVRSSEYPNLTSSNGIQDAVAHMIEGKIPIYMFDTKADSLEIPNAAIEGPKIMIYCVCIGTFTGAIFLIVLLFVPGNIDDIISSSAGPLLQILDNATKNHAGAICLLV